VRLESFIGLRLLLAPRQDRAVSVITWISAVGVMLGVTALIVTISVMNGFRASLFQAVTGTVPHVRALLDEDADAAALEALERRAAALPGVEAVAPYVARQAFLSVPGQFRAVTLRGIDPAREPEVTGIARFVRGAPPGSGAPKERPGSAVLARLTPREPGERAGIVLGAPTARALGLGLGEDLQVISSVLRQTPIGSVPLVKRVQLVGVFETGLGATDEAVAFVDERTARQLFRLERLPGVALRVADAMELDADAWHAALPGARVVTWADEHRNIFQVMRLEKAGLFLILTLILVVSFFNIISSLVMLVLEKRKAIGVLKSLGASDALVRRIFLMQGFWIGSLGTLSGLGLGLGLCWALSTFDIVRLPPGSFPLGTRLPVLVQVSDVLAITAASFLICLSVTLFPATQAARLDPVEILRNE
jgi:lipoprotein-releasing system permease protein